MALSETSLANMALARIGAKRLTDIDADESLEAIQARMHYEQTRNALLRSHEWRFSLTRAVLSEDTESPDFEWDNQFQLPNDFMRMVALYDTSNSYSLEGDLLLTNDDTASILYVRKVTDPTEFDPLFAEILILQLAIKLVMPLSQDKQLRRELQDELRELTMRVRTIDKQETNTVGRADMATWTASRVTDTTI